VGGIVGFSENNLSPATTLTNCVALNISVNRISGTDVNFGTAIGRNTISLKHNYLEKIIHLIHLFTGRSCFGLECIRIDKTQIATAVNW
jgi:hypothetical protein